MRIKTALRHRDNAVSSIRSYFQSQERYNHTHAQELEFMRRVLDGLKASGEPFFVNPTRKGES